MGQALCFDRFHKLISAKHGAHPRVHAASDFRSASFRPVSANDLAFDIKDHYLAEVQLADTGLDLRKIPNQQ